jgi:hypothetical protein
METLSRLFDMWGKLKMVEGLLINGTEVGRIIFLNFANKPGFNAKSKFAKKIEFFQNLIML